MDILPSSFSSTILRWYAKQKRNLPWRRTHDPYRIWVSEVMLQQTRVATVVPYYRRFLKAFPDIAHLARARRDRVMKLWEGLGYYARARNLQRASQEMMATHGGRVPSDPAVFAGLPGVGPYISAAVMSIAFGRPMASVDGNVKRVVARLADVDRPLQDCAGEIRAMLDRRIPRRRPGDFNQAMMELGACVCIPRRPLCESCPVRTFCLSHRRGTVDCRPIRAMRKNPPHKHVVAAYLVRGRRVFIARRPERGLLGGLWEFPGGKIERGETPGQALRREMREELGIDVVVGSRLAVIRHAYSHLTITMSVYRCAIRRGPMRPTEHTALRWVHPADLTRYAMPEVDRKAIRVMDAERPASG